MQQLCRQDRFGACIRRPDPHCGCCVCRHQILKQFAKHLADQSIAAIVKITSGMSGRDLRDLCEGAERRWASKVSNPILHSRACLDWVENLHDCIVCIASRAASFDDGHYDAVSLHISLPWESTHQYI